MSIKYWQGVRTPLPHESNISLFLGFLAIFKLCAWSLMYVLISNGRAQSPLSWEMNVRRSMRREKWQVGHDAGGLSMLSHFHFMKNLIKIVIRSFACYSSYRITKDWHLILAPPTGLKWTRGLGLSHAWHTLQVAVQEQVWQSGLSWILHAPIGLEFLGQLVVHRQAIMIQRE